MMQSVQDKYAPNNMCFGCGPKNNKGLRIKSMVEDHELVARWKPEPYHLAFDGILAGGLCGTLLDCHSNWTAAYNLMLRSGQVEPPCTVTAEYHVKLLKPTPLDQEVVLRAKAIEMSDRKAVVEATLSVAGVVTATCRGIFIAVKEGHPAFHRW